MKLPKIDMKKPLGWLKKHLKPPKIHIKDHHIELTGVVAGFSMAFYGAYLYSPRLAFFGFGLFFMWVFWPGKR